MSTRDFFCFFKDSTKSNQPRRLNGSVYNLEVFIICLAHKKIVVSHTKLYAPELNERKGSSQKSHSGCLTEC